MIANLRSSTKMTNLKKAILTTTSVLGLAVGSTFLLPGSASAATYNDECGSGYYLIDWHDFTDATVFLTYSFDTGDNCVVTVRNSPGAAEDMGAQVALTGDPWISDTGSYTTQAGPVYVWAPSQCIDWGGYSASESYYQYDVYCY
jgi:hypothetical protein